MLPVVIVLLFACDRSDRADKKYREKDKFKLVEFFLQIAFMTAGNVFYCCICCLLICHCKTPYDSYKIKYSHDHHRKVRCFSSKQLNSTLVA